MTERGLNNINVFLFNVYKRFFFRHVFYVFNVFIIFLQRSFYIYAHAYAHSCTFMFMFMSCLRPE